MGDSVVMSRADLVPVGVDLDGSIKPISELSYWECDDRSMTRLGKEADHESQGRDAEAD